MVPMYAITFILIKLLFSIFLWYFPSKGSQVFIICHLVILSCTQILNQIFAHNFSHCDASMPLAVFCFSCLLLIVIIQLVTGYCECYLWSWWYQSYIFRWFKCCKSSNFFSQTSLLLRDASSFTLMIKWII